MSDWSFEGQSRAISRYRSSSWSKMTGCEAVPASSRALRNRDQSVVPSFIERDWCRTIEWPFWIAHSILRMSLARSCVDGMGGG